jgi:hypothetical protein
MSKKGKLIIKSNYKKNIIDGHTEECFGIVAMLDVLGAKQYNKRESEKYLEEIQKIIYKLDKKYDKELKIIKILFGDTIIAYIKFNYSKNNMEDLELINNLVYFSRWIQPIIWEALRNHILLRGAISIGYFYSYEVNKILLGPAVSDVASWYEQSDFFGIICTPLAGFYVAQYDEPLSGIREHVKNDIINEIPKIFVRYDVPLKENRKHYLYSINWIDIYDYDSDYKKYVDDSMNKFKDLTLNNISKYDYYSYIQSFNIPVGTENKYFNTENFIEFCLNKKKK